MNTNIPLDETSEDQMNEEDELNSSSFEAVFNGLDRSLIYLPTYRELFYRWERQQWDSGALDFIPDRIQWEDLLPEEQDEHIVVLSSFYQGEVSVTDALGPYVLAAPDEEMRFFLTTQLVDEARHAVFFDRFFHDALDLGQNNLEASLHAARRHITPASRTIFLEALPEIANRLRQEPDQISHLVEGVVLYHLVVEGMMGLAGQRMLLERLRAENLFPSFRIGMTAVTRDESRHVIFGVCFLRDMLQKDSKHVITLENALKKYAPIALESLMPQEEDIEKLLRNKEDPWKMPRYARESLGKKLNAIGLRNMTLPLPTLPTL